MNIENVAVIILNYKSWNDTLTEAKIIKTLFNLKWQQIIIIDNASPNESDIQLKKNSINEYIYIQTGNNRGYASGNNYGLRYAYKQGFKYCWILNNDIIIEDKNVLKEMLQIFNTNDKIATVNPDILAPDGHMFNRDAKRMTFFDLTIGFLAYRRKGRDIKDLGGYGYVYRPQGCCMMVDLKKIDKVGYMDENTFLYCEEIILAEKLLKYEWKCACVTSSHVIHNHSKTVKSVLGRWKVISTQNKSFSYYLKKYREFGTIKRLVCILFNTLKNYFTN